MMNRRHLLALGAISPVLGLAGCQPRVTDPEGPVVFSAGARPLIDVHTHLFNASDLPVVRFVKHVVLSRYPSQVRATLDIRNPDAVDGLVAMATFLIGRTRAPTARQEIAVLRRRARRVRASDDVQANEQAAITGVADFVLAGDRPGGVSGGAGPRLVRRAILASADLGPSSVSGSGAMTAERAQAIAQRAYHAQTDIGLYLRWFALFTRYRSSLARQLVQDHARQGYRALLVAPAMIDYDKWLDERVTASPLPAQVAVMGQLARQPGPTAVHGYVAFDPLRQVYFDRGVDRAFDPLELVERAITEEGFIGVKLYPPMGFRASQNADRLPVPCAPGAGEACRTDDRTYPEWLAEDLGPDFDVALDEAMDRLFGLCDRLGASVIAHASEGNANGPGYGRRSDPAYWLSVFNRWPTLRVALGHFGGFNFHSNTLEAGPALPAASWEWTLGRYFARRPGAPVFADLSYFVEMSDRSGERRTALAETLRLFIRTFDPDCRQLMFGTDWTMLGQEAAYPTYTRDFETFFREEVQLDDARLHRLFAANAVRFLGLGAGQPNARRLRGWYAQNRLGDARLDMLEAAGEP